MASRYDDSNPSPGSLAGAAGLSQVSRARIIVSVLGMLLAMLLAALDQTIVATALPRVATDLGGLGSFAWVFTRLHAGLYHQHPHYGQTVGYVRSEARSGGRGRPLYGGLRPVWQRPRHDPTHIVPRNPGPGSREHTRQLLRRNRRRLPPSRSGASGWVLWVPYLPWPSSPGL